MPRTPTDYSKSVIYKIEHIDKPELVYVGSTTDFTKRKCQHKTTCNNENTKNYNLKLYTMIRCNNGWESFKIMIICEFPCNSKTELLIEEEKYRKELQASLNSYKAFITNEEAIIDKKEYDKNYRKVNKEKFENYLEINKEQLKEYRKIYRYNNKEKIKEEKKEKGKEKTNCECGSIFRKVDKSKHVKSIKHCQFIQQNK